MRILDFCQLNSLSAAFLQSFAITALKEDNFADHPLNTHKDSMWNKYFRDLELWEEIEKDVRRTRSDLYFFTDALDPEKR